MRHNNSLHWHQRNPALCLQPATAIQCNYNYVSQAIGVGVRYKTPVGPVRFDFGYNLNPPAFPVAWQISIRIFRLRERGDIVRIRIFRILTRNM